MIVFQFSHSRCNIVCCGILCIDMYILRISCTYNVLVMRLLNWKLRFILVQFFIETVEPISMYENKAIFYILLFICCGYACPKLSLYIIYSLNLDAISYREWWCLCLHKYYRLQEELNTKDQLKSASIETIFYRIRPH